MIPLFKVRMERSAIEEAVKVLESNYIGQGKVVEEFEEALRKYFNCQYIVTTNSATSAEHLAFHMLRDRKPYDELLDPGFEGCEVLCSPLTCTATNWPVLLEGYKIKWVDVDPYTCNVDMVDLARKITPNTKIIYFTHWGGYPIDKDRLSSVMRRCRKTHGFRPIIIDDCAHAFGAEYENNWKVGESNITDFSTFSFQAIKHVTAVDGGVLICPLEYYERAKLLRWYGIDRESNQKAFRCEEDIKEIGTKWHMNDVCAAIGLENFKTVDKDISARRQTARYYYEQITSPEVRKIPYNQNSSYWLYTMFVERQDKFMEKMKEKGIMVSRVHERNDKHSCVRKYRRILPNLDKIVKEMICIPVGPWVTEKDREYIVKCINEGW